MRPAGVLAFVAMACQSTPSKPPADHIPAGVRAAVLQHHGSETREGVYVDPAMTREAVRHLRQDAAFSAPFAGVAHADPLYWDGGDGGQDLLIVVTELNEVIAFDPITGARIWSRVLAAPVPRSATECGNIFPLGITGTPVIDATRKLLFLDAMTTPDGATKAHLIYTLSVVDGSVIGAPVDLNTAMPGFDSTAQNQRGALALQEGVLYVPFGGNEGDCGGYFGWVIGIDTVGSRAPMGFKTGAPGGGIWAAPGVAARDGSLFVATGNTFLSAQWQGGEGILKLAPGPTFSWSSNDYYAPSQWRQYDDQDTDVGSSGALPFDVGGARLVAAMGKDGKIHIANRDDLGGAGASWFSRPIVAKGARPSGASPESDSAVPPADTSGVLMRQAVLETAGLSLPRAARGLRLAPRMEALRADLLLALRMLVKAPGFTAVSLLALTLGIGANTVMFSVVNAVVLRPLTYPESQNLMMMYSVQRDTQSPIGASPPDFYRIRESNRSFASVAALYRRPVNLTGGDDPQRIRAIAASADLLRVLQVTPALGRGFSAEDERWGSHQVAILGDGLWRSRFGADPSVIGRSITLDGQSHVVVGVLPSGFSWLGYEAPLLLPMSFAPGDNLNSHNNYFIAVVGRLRGGVTREQARAELSAIGRQIEDQFPESRGLGMDAEALEDSLVAGVRPAILVLLGAVCFVLLIACANLANLLLVRAAARRREIAVRAALGASRARLLRQLLTESVLLALLGAAAGALLAVWATDALNLLGTDVLPRMRDIQVDLRVLGFTLLVALLTATLFGLAPALRGSSIDLRESLNETAPGVDGGRRRLTSALVVAEVALSLVLLAGAGLLLKSTFRLLHVHPGFDAEGVVSADVDLPARKYVDAELGRLFSPAATARAARFFEEVLEGIRTVPGVRAAGSTSSLPLAGEGAWGKRAVFYDRPLPSSANDLPEIQYRVVAGDYFRALGIRVRGRAFAATDGLNAPPVAIVSQELVRRYWKGEDPIGKVLSVNAPRELNPVDTLPPGWRPEKLTVIGVADDVRYGRLDRAPVPVVYAPYAQGAEGALTMSIAVRTDRDPLAVVSALREQIRRVDPDQAVANVSTLESRMSRAVAQPRLQTGLLALFACIAVLLAAIGIYGVMAVSVVQRTREIGIRMALGAVGRDVLALVVRQGLALVATGLALGLAAALALTRVLRSLLFSVSATDPSVFGAIILLLAAVALIACYLPARRASRVDPMVALRHE